jgi:hypothetical protein
MRAWVLTTAMICVAVIGGCKRGGVGADPENACVESPTALYERRIAPILADDQPKSCNECHLSGVDLSLFIRDTPCETMACLAERELVDLRHPDESVILSWIDRADPASGLITQALLDEERAAFLEWIRYSASCQATECAGVTCSTEEDDDKFCPSAREPREGSTPEMVDQGGCTDKDLELLFRDTFYAARSRCYPCHFDNQEKAPKEAPRWVSTQLSCENASLETMHNVVQAGYLDLEHPEQSLIILKPLAEEQGGGPHGGHEKITKEDRIYANFLYWIERYAACQVPPADAGARDAAAN